MNSEYRSHTQSSKKHKHSFSSRQATQRKTGAEFLYGILPIQAALLHRKRPLFHLYIKEHASSKRIAVLQQRAEEIGISVHHLKSKQIEALCPSVPHQGVVLACGPLPYATMLELNNPQAHQVFVALDQVADPQNLGAIIRSCSFFEISGVIVPQHHSSQLTPTVSKTSAGTVEHFPVIAVSNLSQFLKVQKKQGYWIVGLDQQAEQNLSFLKWDRSYILVVGNEGRGLRPLVHSLCDWCVQIPGNAQVSSLNVSNATAIALYHLTHISLALS